MTKPENKADKAYQDFKEDSKVKIPFNINEIALEKVNTFKKKEKIYRLKVWTSSIAAAALITIGFILIKPYSPQPQLYSQALTDSQKKEQFEKALKIINESLSIKEQKNKTLYNDDKFKIILDSK